ncbi:hypothetical protein CAOG_05215 [Capsaspora owczarzaki ATCC 30864]|nr:hypothetical protein CAOG_05215 [Capsaspora owczarzaki ATCC 30864]|eukprot:XP_004346900.2 hypothetical protein CAOG_05215 [Capsaspora owczarzaki ATCC 30864]
MSRLLHDHNNGASGSPAPAPPPFSPSSSSASSTSMPIPIAAGSARHAQSHHHGFGLSAPTTTGGSSWGGTSSRTNGTPTGSLGAVSSPIFPTILGPASAGLRFEVDGSGSSGFSGLPSTSPPAAAGSAATTITHAQASATTNAGSPYIVNSPITHAVAVERAGSAAPMTSGGNESSNLRASLSQPKRVLEVILPLPPSSGTHVARGLSTEQLVVGGLPESTMLSRAQTPVLEADPQLPSPPLPPGRVRIAYNPQSTSEAMDRMIRSQCKIKRDHEYHLEDADGDVVVIEGSMREGVYTLRMIDTNSGPDESESDEESISVARTAPFGAKIHHTRGHEFVAKHFHAIELCYHCRMPLLGLGKQGYICLKCLTTCHKKCHAEYSIPCGKEPGDLEFKCGACRNYYTEDENSDTACAHHPHLHQKSGVCSRCYLPWNKTNGCVLGRHRPLLSHGKKLIRKNVVGKGFNQLATQLSIDTNIFRKFVRSMSLTKPGASAAIEEDDGDEEDLEPEPVTDPGPEIPRVRCDCTDHYKVAFFARDFPCSVSELFELAFSSPEALVDVEVNALVSFNNVSTTPWQHNVGDALLSESRKRTFTMPLVGRGLGGFGLAKTTICHQNQHIIWKHDRNCFCLEVASVTPDLPMGDSFVNLTRYCVSANSRYSCHALVAGEVKFLKNIRGQNLIVAKSHEGIRSYLLQWGAAVTRHVTIRRNGRLGTPSSTQSLDMMESASNMASSSAQASLGIDEEFERVLPSWLTAVFLYVIVGLLASSIIMYIRIAELTSAIDLMAHDL